MNEELIQLTLVDLLQNPTGKGSSQMANRKMIIEGMDAKYFKLLKEHSNFTFKIFKNQDNYYFKFKMPSESVNGLYYDVIIMFHPENKEIKEDKTLNRYNLRLFSNSPNFTYTYTYILNKSKIIVPDFIKHCSDTALKEPPKVKNPVGSYGFEKSCYFACRYIKEMGLYNKDVIDKNLTVYSKESLLKDVSHQEAKMKEYNLMKAHSKKSVSETKRAKTTSPSGLKTTKKKTPGNKKRKK